MPRVLVIFLFKRVDEPRHFDCRDEALSFAFSKPHNANGGIWVIFRNEACDLPPVEHFTYDFKATICGVRIGGADLRMDRFHVRGRDAYRQSRFELREDAPLQMRFIVLPLLLFLLGMVLYVRDAEFADSLQLPLLIGLIERVLLVGGFTPSRPLPSCGPHRASERRRDPRHARRLRRLTR